MTEARIGVQCTAVPDGVLGNGKVRLSLVLTPDVRAGHSLTGLTLQNWPNVISNFIKNKHLLVFGCLNDGKSLAVPFTNDDAVVANADEANALWQKIFHPDVIGPPYDGFDYLFEALQQNTKGEPDTDERTKALKEIAEFLKLPDKNGGAGTPVVDALRNQSQTVSIGNLKIEPGSLNWVPTQYLDAALNTFHDDSHLVRILALVTAQERRSKGAAAATRLLSIVAGVDGQNQNAALSKTLSGIFGGTADDASNWIAAIAAAFVARPFRQRVLGSVQDTVLRYLLQAGLGGPGSDSFGLLKSLPKTQNEADNRASARHDNDIQQMLRHALMPVVETFAAPTELGFVKSRDDGIAMMRSLFNAAVRQHAPKAPGKMAMPVAFTDHMTAAGDSFDGFHKHWRNNTRAIKADEKADAKRRDEAARRKFFGIRALPALAKFLRLTVDIEVQSTALKDYNSVTAFFADDPNDRVEVQNRLAAAAWTGFDTAAGVVFRPASFQTHPLGSKAPELQTAPPIADGVVNLRSIVNNKPRFMITVLDLPAAVGSMRVKAEQDAGSQRDGTMLDTVSSKITERQSRGLQVIDSMAPANVASEVFNSWHKNHTNSTTGDKAPTSRPGDKARPYFAEDLAIGYRAYAQRWRRLSDEPKAIPPWRSLVARQVNIDEIAGAVAKSTYRELQMRDHGYIRPAHKILSDAGDENGTPTTDGQMFAWMGSSLALSKQLDGSTNYAHGPGPGQDPEYDLALDIEYGFLHGQEALQPALRTGDGYMIGLSPVYPNCGGPTFHEAKKAFDDQKQPVTLGDAAHNPFPFGPPREIPPPQLLMSDAEAKLWQKTEDAKAADHNNAENIVRIVLRSATVKPRDTKDNVTRYLVPPRANFEVAEQSGMFDGVSDPTPKGAFNDYEQDPTVGGFTSDDPLFSPEKASIPPQHQRSRSPVLRPIGNAPPKAPYYPDPLARNLKVAFERDGATPAGFPDAVPLKEFWKEDASPITAKPIELLVKRWPDAYAGGQIDFGDTAGKVNGVKFAASGRVDRLTVEIAPAEEVNLQFWCVPDFADLMRSNAMLSGHFQTAAHALIPHILATRSTQSTTRTPGTTQKSVGKTSVGQPVLDPLASAVGLVAKGLSTKQLSANGQFSSVADLLPTVDIAFDTVFSALTSQTPENGINAWLTVKIIHAVEQPLAVPSVPCNEKSRDPNKLAIQAIRVAQNTAWKDYTSDVKNYFHAVGGPAANLITPSNPASAFGLQSEDNGATAYFVGQIEIDRASTGEVRIEAGWQETDPASAIRVVKEPNGTPANAPKTYKLEPLQKDRPLLTIKVPRDGGLNPIGQLDLTYDETGSLRGLNYPFTDTRSHEISLRIVATSRFASDFPATPQTLEQPDPDALGRFDVESRPPIGSKRLEGDRSHPESYRQYKIIVPATAPPPMPVVSDLEWVMPEKLTDFDPGRRVSVEKEFYPRLYIGQDWCGTDDLLAVVCAPEDLVSYRRLSVGSEAPQVLQPIPLSAWELLNAPRHRSIPASSFTDTNGSYVAIAEDVSRWGSDPSVTSGALTGAITRERFSGFVSTTPNVPLPGKDTTKVSLFLYRPLFDQYRGEFYVDIGIDPGAAHSPVVQLVVARYQPHVTKPEFHLSATARVRPFQIAPKRKVEVIIHDERNITAIVQGVGYTDRLPEIPQSLRSVGSKEQSAPPAKYASRMKYPLQNIRVIGLLDDNSMTGIQIHNEGGQALAVRRVPPQFFHPELIWIAEFKLPTSPTSHHYGLHIEEIDFHFADEAYESGADPDMHLVDRLSTFSLTVDLERGLFSSGQRKDQISPRG